MLPISFRRAYTNAVQDPPALPCEQAPDQRALRAPTRALPACVPEMRPDRSDARRRASRRASIRKKVQRSWAKLQLRDRMRVQFVKFIAASGRSYITHQRHPVIVLRSCFIRSRLVELLFRIEQIENGARTELVLLAIQ